MKSILVLGAGRNQAPIIEKAKSMGLRVIAIDPADSAPGLALADVAHILDLGCHEECLQIARKEHVSGVITIAAEYPVPTLGFLCESLVLPGISQRTARLATNKYEMRQAFCNASVPQPRFFRVTSVAEAVSAIRETGDTAIFKPVVGNGKKGITVIRADSPFEVIERAFARAQAFTRNQAVMVEEYVSGPEYSIEAITFADRTHVLAITEKFTSDEPYCVELGHLQPARLNAASAAMLKGAALSAIAAVGIENSPSHTEIRLTDQGPRVMEIGARMGGGFIASHLVPLSTGIDLMKASIDVAMGAPPDVSPSRFMAAAIRFLTAPSGQVMSISGVDEVRKRANVVDVSVYVSAGDEVRRLIDNSCRVGHIICSGPLTEVTPASLERTLALLCIATDSNAVASPALG